MQKYIAAQVVAALQRGDEFAFNPDVLRFDKDEHAGIAHGFIEKPGVAVTEDLPRLLYINLVLAFEYALQNLVVYFCRTSARAIKGTYMAT